MKWQGQEGGRLLELVGQCMTLPLMGTQSSATGSVLALSLAPTIVIAPPPSPLWKVSSTVMHIIKDLF